MNVINTYTCLDDSKNHKRPMHIDDIIADIRTAALKRKMPELNNTTIIEIANPIMEKRKRYAELQKLGNPAVIIHELVNDFGGLYNANVKRDTIFCVCAYEEDNIKHLKNYILYKESTQVQLFNSIGFIQLNHRFGLENRTPMIWSGTDAGRFYIALAIAITYNFGAEIEKSIDSKNVS